MATGGKWSWSDAEVHAIAQGFQGTQAVRDRCWFLCDVVWGYRISEVLSLTVGQVLDADGNIRDVLTVNSSHLKGGKKPKTSSTPKPKPADDVNGCRCKLCMPPARKRRPPDDRQVPIPASLKPHLRALLDRLAKTRNGLHPDRFLFESRKRDKDGCSRPISRQQGWYALRQAMQRAHIPVQHFGTHSMRKTSAQNLMELTKDITVVRDHLGHRSSATTDRYLQSDNRARFAFVAQVGERLIIAA